MNLIKPGPSEVDFYFDKVIELVENGMNVSEALIKLKLSKMSFFRRISQSQRDFLYNSKALNVQAFSHKELLQGINFLNENY